MKKVITTQLDLDNFEKMETLREVMGMKRSQFIQYLLKMYLLAYPNIKEDLEKLNRRKRA